MQPDLLGSEEEAVGERGIGMYVHVWCTKLGALNVCVRVLVCTLLASE